MHWKQKELSERCQFSLLTRKIVKELDYDCEVGPLLTPMR